VFVKFPPLDPSRVVTYPLEQRKSKVGTDILGTVWKPGGYLKEFFHTLPQTLASADLLEIVQRIAEAVRKQRPVILGMGAHPIKVGLSPLIIDLLERGILSAVAMNGAGIIHDFELAYQGHTSEDVAGALVDGSFGMAQETG
jgi:deoxyhypusine synthase